MQDTTKDETIKERDEVGEEIARFVPLNGTFADFKKEVGEFFKERDIAVDTDVLIPAEKVHVIYNDDASKDSSEGDENALQLKMHKLRKRIPASMIEDFEAMSEAELHSRIVQCEVNIHDTEKARERDGELKNLKDKVKLAQAPYNEAKRLQRSISEYCTCLLDQKGKA